MAKTWYGHHIENIKGEEYILHKDYLELDKEIERLKAREEEITQKYLSSTKYASEIEEKYVVDEYIIDELEMYLKRKVEETIGNKAKYYDRVLRELYKLKEGE